LVRKFGLDEARISRMLEVGMCGCHGEETIHEIFVLHGEWSGVLPQGIIANGEGAGCDMLEVVEKLDAQETDVVLW
jgi:hypothetical protein